MDPQFIIKKANLKSYIWIRILNRSRRWIAPLTAASENPIKINSQGRPKLPPLREIKIINEKIRHPSDVTKYNDSWTILYVCVEIAQQKL
jgi:hypothetical protein